MTSRMQNRQKKKRKNHHTLLLSWFILSIAHVHICDVHDYKKREQEVENGTVLTTTTTTQMRGKT